MVRGAGLQFGDGGTGGKGAEVSMASTGSDPRGSSPGGEGQGWTSRRMKAVEERDGGHSSSNKESALPQTPPASPTPTLTATRGNFSVRPGRSPTNTNRVHSGAREDGEVLQPPPGWPAALAPLRCPQGPAPGKPQAP